MDKKIFFAIGIAIAAAMTVLMFIPTTITSDQPKPIETLKNEKLGLVINTPTSQVTLDELNKVYSEASLTGIGRSNHYLFWNQMEPEQGKFNWKDTDILMSLNKNNGLQVTLYFSIVNGRITGPFPDWMGTPSLGTNLEQKTIKTLDAILTRYDGVIDYVIIGGSLDSYFDDADGSVNLYKEYFGNVYSEIKQKHPNVKMGNAFSLNNVLNKKLESYVTDVGQLGDFVAFTYLPVDRLNDISKTPQEARADLQKALDIAGDKKIAFFETSWSTSDFVKGSEQDQAEFVKIAYDFYRQNKSEIEFFNWYRQFDRPEGSCTINQQFSESQVAVTGDQHVRERLGHYVCDAGLIKTDNSPKTAWNELKKQIQSS
ncbi:MAG: hypothetical protein ACREAX_04760 [Candidatus Nitrosotenuis sp.]